MKGDEQNNGFIPAQAASSSNPLATPALSSSMSIPAYGVEFFEYRRRLFLAGLPLPEPSNPVPESYTVSLPFPEPLPPVLRDMEAGSSIGKLEAFLAIDGIEDSEDAWNAGLSSVHERLEGSKRLKKPLRLGLVIKVLKAGWIRDGTWPVDKRTQRALLAPPSPVQSASRPPAVPPPIKTNTGAIPNGTSINTPPIPSLDAASLRPQRPERRGANMTLDNG